MSVSTDERRAQRSSIIVGTATFLSRLLGVVRTRVLATVFGSGPTADVINFTFNIPNNFRKLFGEGAINAAIIPTFSSMGAAEERQRRGLLFRLLLTYQLLLFVPIILITYRWGDAIISLFSDFSSASQIALGGALLGPFMLYLLCISAAALFGAVLQAHHRFLVAYLAPLCFSVAVIALVLLLTPIIGPMSMAVATVVGGGAQAAVSYFALRREGYRARLALRAADTPLFATLKAWALVSLGMVGQVITQLITYRFASQLETGSVTALANSTIFYQTPYGIIFNAIAAVSLPLLATAFATADHSAFIRVSRRAFNNLTALLIPASILLFVLAHECVSVLLQSGNFTYESAQLTAQVLRGYLVFLLPTALYAMLLRVGYAVNKYRMMTGMILLQNTLDILLMWGGLRAGLGIIALPLANGISLSIVALLLAFALTEHYSLLSDRYFWRSLLRVSLANLPLVAAGLLYRTFTSSWWAIGSTLGSLVRLLLIGSAFLVLLLISYWVAKIPLLQLLRGRGMGDYTDEG